MLRCTPTHWCLETEGYSSLGLPIWFFHFHFIYFQFGYFRCFFFKLSVLDSLCTLTEHVSGWRKKVKSNVVPPPKKFSFRSVTKKPIAIRILKYANDPTYIFKKSQNRSDGFFYYSICTNSKQQGLFTF